MPDARHCTLQRRILQTSFLMCRRYGQRNGKSSRLGSVHKALGHHLQQINRSAIWMNRQMWQQGMVDQYRHSEGTHRDLAHLERAVNERTTQLIEQHNVSSSPSTTGGGKVQRQQGLLGVFADGRNDGVVGGDEHEATSVDLQGTRMGGSMTSIVKTRNQARQGVHKAIRKVYPEMCRVNSTQGG